MFINLKQLRKQYSARQLVVLLTLLSTGLLGALIVSITGPRITDIRYSNLPNESVRLTMTTKLRSIEDVTIVPATPFDYRIDERDVIFFFTKPLEYNVTYQIAFRTTDTRGKTAVNRQRFTTPDPTLYYLQRSTDSNDQIFKTNISNVEPTPILSYEHIATFAVSRDAVATVHGKDDLAITLTDLSGGKPREIQLPEAHTVHDLVGHMRSTSFIIQLMHTETYQISLWKLDPQTREITKLLLPNGEQRIGTNTSFLADGRSFIYLDKEGIGVIADVESADAELRIGSAARFLRALPDNTGIYYATTTALNILLNSGALNNPPKDIQTSSQSTIFRDKEQFIYTQYNYQEASADGTNLKQQLKKYRAGSSVILDEYDAKSRQINALTMSPNDQFAITEEAIQPIVYDVSPINPRPVGSVTLLRDSNSGYFSRLIEGILLQWHIEPE